MVISVLGGLMSLKLHQCSCLPTGGSLYRLHITNAVSTSKDTSIETWNLPLYQVSISSWRCPLPSSPYCWFQNSIHSHDHLTISLPLTTPEQELLHSPPNRLSTQIPPSICLSLPFHSPFQERNKHPCCALLPVMPPWI